MSMEGLSFLLSSVFFVYAAALQAPRASHDSVAMYSSGATELLRGTDSKAIEGDEKVRTHVPEVAVKSPLLNGRTSSSKCGDIRSFGSKQDSGKNVTIASMFIGDPEHSWTSVKKNHVNYAKQHGLNYFAPDCDHTFTYGAFDRGMRVPTWGKMAIIQYLFDSGSDAVFWMDADSLFMDYNKDIRHFMKTEEDLIFVGDCGEVFNAGHFLLRNTEWSKWFLQEVYATCPPPIWNDNAAMLVILGGGTSREPTGWKPAVDHMMARCVSAEDAAECAKRVTPAVSPHVRAMAQQEMNTYTHADCPNAASTSVTELRRSKEVPFIVHEAGRPNPYKSEELPVMASLVRGASLSPSGSLIEGQGPC